jgi:hypothetical protein
MDWPKEDLAALTKIVELHGKMWDIVTIHFNLTMESRYVGSVLKSHLKNQKQCRDAYNKKSMRIPISDRAKIIKLQKIFGNQWILISKHMPAYSPRRLSNIWHRIKPKMIDQYQRQESSDLMILANAAVLDY